MANGSKTETPESPFAWNWPLPWGWPNLAPQQLTQPINPGWSFGNVVVNNTNSSAPDVEEAVVSHHSYGRQIGRITDALLALADALGQPRLEADPRMKALRALHAEVEAIKRATGTQRLQRLREELQELKACDPAAWKQLAALLR